MLCSAELSMKKKFDKLEGLVLNAHIYLLRYIDKALHFTKCNYMYMYYTT